MPSWHSYTSARMTFKLKQQSRQLKRSRSDLIGSEFRPQPALLTEQGSNWKDSNYNFDKVIKQMDELYNKRESIRDSIEQLKGTGAAIAEGV